MKTVFKVLFTIALYETVKSAMNYYLYRDDDVDTQEDM